MLVATKTSTDSLRTETHSEQYFINRQQFLETGLQVRKKKIKSLEDSARGEIFGIYELSYGMGSLHRRSNECLLITSE